MHDHLTFTQPVWLFLLGALIPLVLLRARSQRFRDLAIAALIAPRLRGRLLVGHRAATHWARFALQLLALASLLIALAGPRYGSIEEATFAEGRNVLIGIDTSRSMLAADLKPDRLTRAKLAAHDLIRSLPEDRIGLIAFAGTSFLQAPLTVDHEAVIESISQLDTEIIPRGGTNLGRAVLLARETFKDAESDNNAFILFTDGEDLEDAKFLDDFKRNEDDVKMNVIAVGVGTAAGSIIPDPASDNPGGFVRDAENNIVRSRLDATHLKALAGVSGGLYLNLNSTAAMEEVVTGALDRLEKTAMEGRTIHKPIDRYRWVLVPGILFVLLSLIPHPAGAALARANPGLGPARRTALSSTTAVTLAFLASVNVLPAANPSDAYRKYQNGDYENAVESYERRIEENLLQPEAELHYGAASAAYKMGDFQKAIESYGRALLSKKESVQEKAHYSLGNALYREGEARLEEPQESLLQWRNALDHYEAALEINPGNEDARFNLEFVKRLLEQLEKQQQGQQGQQNQEQQQQGQDGSQSQEGQQGSRSDQQQDSSGKQGQQREGDSGEQGEKRNQDGESEGDQDQSGKMEEESEPLEGELQAEKDQPGQAPGEPGRERERPHPETGFTRSQARQLLRSLADEDLDVRPLVPPSNERFYKNW